MCPRTWESGWTSLSNQTRLRAAIAKTLDHLDRLETPPGERSSDRPWSRNEAARTTFPNPHETPHGATSSDPHGTPREGTSSDPHGIRSEAARKRFWKNRCPESRVHRRSSYSSVGSLPDRRNAYPCRCVAAPRSSSASFARSRLCRYGCLAALLGRSCSGRGRSKSLNSAGRPDLTARPSYPSGWTSAHRRRTSRSR